MAIDSNMKDLQIVYQVLPDKALDLIERRLNCAHYSILARWAIQSPEELMKLYQSHEITFLERVCRQEDMETEAIFSERGQEMMERGLSKWEVLSEMGINTELVDF